MYTKYISPPQYAKLISLRMVILLCFAIALFSLGNRCSTSRVKFEHSTRKDNPSKKLNSGSTLDQQKDITLCQDNKKIQDLVEKETHINVKKNKKYFNISIENEENQYLLKETNLDNVNKKREDYSIPIQNVSITQDLSQKSIHDNVNQAHKNHSIPIENKEKPQNLSDKEMIPISCDASIERHDKNVEALQKKSIHVDKQDTSINKGGITDLHKAVKKDDIKTVKRLLQAGVKVDEQDQNGYTALHIAAECKKEQIVNLLIKNRCAKLNLKTNFGYTPLIYHLYLTTTTLLHY